MNLLRGGVIGLAMVAGVGWAAIPAAAADKGGAGYVERAYPSIWQGAYAGVHVGFGNADSADGIVGGGQLGYNWQANRIVYGLEADVSAADIGVDERVCMAGVGCAHASASLDWMATVRGRVGYLVDPRLLVYATAGLGIVGWSGEAGVPGGFKISRDGTDTGFVFGVGAEGKLTETMTARIEYFGFNDDSDAGVVRGGLNFKLGQ